MKRRNPGDPITKGSIVKHKTTGKLYTIDFIVHSMSQDGNDVFACHKLSEYDGMPIGPQVIFGIKEVE